MRFIVLLSVLLASLPVLAQDREVPDPIPADFDECVRVFVTDKGRENGVKSKVARLDPPLTREDHAYLEYWRREGWATLKLCGDTEQS